MIVFYRTKDCSGCRSIQDVLEELVLAHKVILVDGSGHGRQHLPEGARPPVLVDEDEIVQGSRNIVKHLEKLEKFKKLWEKFQSDACYCDEEGNVE